MRIEEFIAAIKEEVQRLVNENCRVEIHYVQKNNVGAVPALNIMEEGVEVSPNFYLNDMYEEFQKNGAAVEELAEKLVEIHYGKIKECQEMNASSLFQNQEDFRGRLFFRLVHYDSNREMLEETPHVKLLDLALVYYAFVSRDEKTVGSMRMSHELFHRYGWNAEEMYQEVLANTVRLFPEKITTLSKMVKEIADEAVLDGEILPEDPADVFWEQEYPIVITNTTGVNGAAVIAYPGLLRKLAEKFGHNLFLLPSSTHECMALPDNGAFLLENLESMVVSVNRESLEPQEFLSDHVYYYDAGSDRLLIADAAVIAGQAE